MCCMNATERGEIMNINRLKGKIVESGLNIGQVAELIGINRTSFYRKLHDFEKLTVREAIALKKVLNLNDEEAYKIFLEK